MQVMAEQQAMRMHRQQLQQASLLIPQRAQAPMHFLRWVPYWNQDRIFRLTLATFSWKELHHAQQRALRSCEQTFPPG